MKSWLCASAAALLLGGAFAALAATPSGEQKRRNELSLAGLRPGRDTLRTATNLHGPHYREVVPGARDVLAWVDIAKHRVLRVELGPSDVIQSITVSSIDPAPDQPEHAKGARDVPLVSRQLATGRGIRIGHSVRKEVIEMYGEPNSSGPST